MKRAVLLAFAIALSLSEVGAQDEGIAKVVVTAQKRKEDASKVPVSISVIGGDELEAQHIVDYADITRAIPNVSFSGAGAGGDSGDGPGLSNIEIRGISSSAGSATVGIYMDDVSMTVANLYSMGSPEPKFFDLDHVEVLRGPQGTLYGASSMGGTIKFITNQPNLKENSTDIDTELSTIKGGKSSYTGSMVLNKVLSPGELALRLCVQAGHKGGYIDQVNASGNVIDSGINWQDDTVVKLAMKWAPTKALNLTPSIFYQKVKTGDTDVSYNQLLVSGVNTGIDLSRYQTSKLTHEPGSDELIVPSLTLNYSTSHGDLTSVTSYFKRSFKRAQDGTVTNSAQMGAGSVDASDPCGQYIDVCNYPALGVAVAALPSSVTLDNEVTQFSQEIRFASPPYEAGGNPFTWLAGAYIANEHTNVLENDFVYGLNATFNSFGLSPTDINIFVPGTFAPGFPNDNTFDGAYRYHDTQQSIFGEVSYYIVPTFHATVGMRYLRAQEEFIGVQGLFYQGANNVVNIVSQSGNKFTPKVSLIWEASPTNSIYATAAEGFRVGGTNSQVPWQLCGLPGPNQSTFGPDSLWSYELGNKSRFFHNKLTVNGSLFYVKWKNTQQQIELGCSFDYNTNVGDATSYGAEIEIKAKPLPNLLLDLAAGYTHATLDNTLFDANGNMLYGAVAGTAIPGVPNYNIALTGTYTFNIRDEYTGFIRGAARFVGSSHGGFPMLPGGDVNPDFNRGAYHLFDASTGLSWGNWEASIYVKNLLNNNRVIQRPIVQATLGEVFRLEPRSVGVTLAAKF